jgi:endonuclease/exonuclease/phosphatase family metal-dependent hydrolase
MAMAAMTSALTLATYNIHGAVGTDGRFSPARIAGVLSALNADIVALQEVPLGGEHWPNVLHQLEHWLPLVGVEGYTFSVGQRRFGNAILTRYPIVETRRINLSVAPREPRGALDADIHCEGRRMRVIATHLGLCASERTQQVGRLLEAFDSEQIPVILMGDVNEWFVCGRSLRTLVSHFRSVPAPATFPSRWPVFALDRIWIRPRHQLLKVAVYSEAQARRASDHLPLVANIQL